MGVAPPENAMSGERDDGELDLGAVGAAIGRRKRLIFGATFACWRGRRCSMSPGTRTAPLWSPRAAA